jgi:hypothetical protein
MAKPTPDSEDSIEGLLQQRAQYEQWLARLDSAGDKAPPTVRAKIRGDYEARLRGVIDQLRGHAATIAEELDRHKTTQSGLDRDKRRVEDDLAEAEVRHAVGEFTEEEWRRISDESSERLSRLRDDLRSVGSEISRLSEVQGLIGGPSKPAPAPTPPAPEPASVAPMPEPEPEPAPVVDAVPPPPPRPAPRPPVREPEPAHAAPPGDELAFIKSVSEEERKPAPPPPPPSRRASNPGPGGSARAESPVQAGAATAAGKPGGAGVAKTLKCGECGTLNRPTEWYCERCGAELAGI